MFGDTPLHRAAKNGHTEIARIFMDTIAESDNNPPNCDGITPLHNAARNGHWKTVQMFVENIKYLSPRTDSGDTPLHLAAKNGHLKVSLNFLRKHIGAKFHNLSKNHILKISIFTKFTFFKFIF